MVEDQDYDAVMWWKEGDGDRYAAIQLKETVPKTLYFASELNDELSKLEKYVNSENTIVAMHLNQQQRLEFADIVIPKTTCAEIWLYGSVSRDQSTWLLYGDLLSQPALFELKYPT